MGHLSLAETEEHRGQSAQGLNNWKGFGSVHGFFCELSQHMLGGTEETYEERQSE